MKKLKNVLYISMIFFIIISVFNKVQGVGNVSLTSNKSTCNVGEEFLININISGMSTASFTVKINIDTSKVEYISGPSNSNFVNGRIIYTWTDPSGGGNPKTSGTVASFRLKAKTSGTANFSISGDFFDANENPIMPSFSGTNVTVKEAEQNSQTNNENSNNQNTNQNNNQTTNQNQNNNQNNDQNINQNTSSNNNQAENSTNNRRANKSK